MITNPTAVRFANDQARPMADRLAKAYYAAKQIVNNWNAQQLAGLLPPGSATVIDDGSSTDGRSPISADAVYGIVLRAQALIDDLEANGAAKLTSILAVAVNVNP